MSKGVKKKGFTLVELVVVLAIFGLLASITGLGLYSWTRYSINKENNENARTIFLAAQESLTHMQASGTLGELNLEHVYLTEVDKIKSQNEGMDFSNFDKFSNRLYTAIYTPNNRTGIVYKILEPYLKDTGIFDGAIAIEFDPKDGVVYSVFYSKKATSFEYETDGNINESGVIGICKRDSGTLKDRLLGYYAADLTAAKPIETPVVYFDSVEGSKDVQLINEEELYYRIPFSALKISNKEQLLNSSNAFDIYIYDSDYYKNYAIKLSLKGNEINDGGVSRFFAKFRTKDDDNGGGGGLYDDGYVDLRTYILNNELRIVFDSIDVNTINKLSASNITFNTEIDGFANYNKDFESTYSIFNLLKGIKNKNNDSNNDVGFFAFYCKSDISISGTPYNFDSSDTHSYLYKNIIFENNTFTVEISNIRHLFNICYLEKINNTKNYTINYKQVNDFSYDGNYVFSTVNGHTGLSEVDSFPALPYLSTRSTYSASDGAGNNYSIKNLTLNSNLLNFYSSGTNNFYKYSLGIFAENNGVIKNLELENAILVNDKSNGDNSNNTTTGSGIISAVNNGKIENCKVSGSITGEVNIGGITGINRSKINNCISEVSINPKSFDSYNLGGIAGLMISDKNYPYWQSVQEDGIEAYISNCEYIPDNYLSEDMLSESNNPFVDYIKGYHIGGILGESKGFVMVKNCKTTTNNEGYIIGYNSVGGIVGICDNNLWLSSSYNEQTRSIYNEANIIGSDCVGGVIGNINNTNESNERVFSNLENRGAIVCIKLNDNKMSAGGITAYLNKKTTIYNCLSNVESTNVKQLLSEKYSDNNVVGGLIGDLRGKIESNEIVDHKVLVGGGDNVGGLVGYCYSGSVILNQRIISGYVFGTNNVGGLIGYNELKFYGNGLNSNLFENSLNLVSGENNVGGLLGYSTQELNSSDIYTHSINLVKGKNYVGGLVGHGNLNICNQCVKANVSGNENVGGIIGENKQNIQIYKEQVAFNEVNVRGNISVGGIAGINNGSIYDVFVKGTVEASGENGGGFAGINKNKIQNYKTGINEITVSGNNKIGGISGTNDGEIYSLSFDGKIISTGEKVGGITGINNGKVQIDGAKTISVSVSGGNSVGGIAGENNKEIYDLSVKATVTGTGDNVGGIAGTNKGKIQLKEQYKNVANVSGVSNVGGVVGDNEGTIYNINVKANVSGKGNNIGGIVGINKHLVQLNKSLLIEMDVDGVNCVGGVVGHNKGTLSEALVTGSVDSNEDCSGGVVGKNDGTVSEIAISEITVKGRDYVGGYVGENLNKISNIGSISNIQITGHNIVGGLFGYTKISNWVCGNINVDNLTVTGNNYVGGFAGKVESDKNINDIYCKVNNSSIDGANYVSGIFGQLTKYNEDFISIKGEVKKSNITGYNYVAGVLPLVEENICISQDSSTSLEGVTITISNNENKTYSGLVSAVNNGEICNTTVTNSTINGTVNSYIGGIAGLNYGKISSSKVMQSTIKYGDLSSAGFISGKNEGIIQDSGVHNNSYIANENSEISTAYLGDITGINGSLSVLNGNEMAKISACKSVNLVPEGDQREIGIVGINIAKIEKTSLFNDYRQNLVDRAWNTDGKKNELTLCDPIRNSDDTLTISFSDYYSSDLKFKLIINALNIQNDKIISNSTYNVDNGDVDCDLQTKTCKYTLASDKVVGNNVFVVYVENLDDRTENSINNLSSISSSSYYYEIPLSTVDFEVSNENNLFKITYTPLNADVANYIDKYQLKYQIDDSSVNIVEFTNNYLELNGLAGNNVQFAVIAVPKAEYGFYAESETVWKQYSIANTLSMENNIAEVNENIEVNENQNLGVENE